MWCSLLFLYLFSSTLNNSALDIYIHTLYFFFGSFFLGNAGEIAAICRSGDGAKYDPKDPKKLKLVQYQLLTIW